MCLNTTKSINRILIFFSTPIRRPSTNPLLLTNNADALHWIGVGVSESAVSAEVGGDSLGEPGDSAVGCSGAQKVPENLDLGPAIIAVVNAAGSHGVGIQRRTGDGVEVEHAGFVLGVVVILLLSIGVDDQAALGGGDCPPHGKKDLSLQVPSCACGIRWSEFEHRFERTEGPVPLGLGVHVDLDAPLVFHFIIQHRVSGPYVGDEKHVPAFVLVFQLTSQFFRKKSLTRNDAVTVCVHCELSRIYKDKPVLGKHARQGLNVRSRGGASVDDNASLFKGWFRHGQKLYF